MVVSLVKDYVHTFPYPYDDLWFKMSPAFRFLVDSGVIDLEKGAEIPYRCEGVDEIAFELDGPWSGSDYSGDDITESNQRSLARDYKDIVIDSTRYWGHSPYGLQVDVYFGWGENADHAMDLAENLVSLKHDYPLYDEEDNSKLLDERAERAWDGYMESDIASDIEKRLGIDLDLRTDKAGEIFWETCSDHEIYPEAEGHRDVLMRGTGDEEFQIDLARRVLEAQGPEFPDYLYDLTDLGYEVLADYMVKQFEGQCPGQMSIL
ncbi:hypothetical protein E1264_03350 [Actinomadura sp. KC216]|uniref:hypothetical protein n=1 Tax=Actinomadura sp. KC216 TaxID=2530370 RepID=UPI00104635D0|nr:hypothetical protein [Actinomadura sp. KC216]TDB90875.1 hypothetical protein E1264_03350 [Actinomadura sp. KC216]